MKRLRASFEGFDGLPHQNEKFTSSRSAQLHGYDWQLTIFPGGVRNDDGTAADETAEVYVAIQLDRVDKFPAIVKAQFALRLVNQHTVDADDESNAMVELFGQRDPTRNVALGWGCPLFIRRKDVLDERQGWLKGNALLVEADIRVYTDAPPLWHPPSRLADDFIALFGNAKRSDVMFVVGGERVPAHRAILHVRAPALSSLCDDARGDAADEGDAIEISEVAPAVFKEVLRFAYGDALSSADALATADGARALLDAADRFGVVRLKQLAELALAERHLTVESAADLLLLADAHSCPQLKETAAEFFVERAGDVMASGGWPRLAQSTALLGELMGDMAAASAHTWAHKRRVPPPADGDGEGVDRAKRLRVSELRRELSDGGCDTDGARKVLEARCRDMESAMAPS